MAEPEVKHPYSISMSTVFSEPLFSVVLSAKCGHHSHSAYSIGFLLESHDSGDVKVLSDVSTITNRTICPVNAMVIPGRHPDVSVPSTEIWNQLLPWWPKSRGPPRRAASQPVVLLGLLGRPANEFHVVCIEKRQMKGQMKHVFLLIYPIRK